MKLYFAYGSNMANGQMLERCPQHSKKGFAVLRGYRWIINRRGFANVVKSENDEVEGILFALSPTDEASLDSREGVAKGSYHKVYLPVLQAHHGQIALVYIDPITAEGKPAADYIERMNEALADAGLSEDYVQRYIRPFIPAQ